MEQDLCQKMYSRELDHLNKVKKLRNGYTLDGISAECNHFLTVLIKHFYPDAFALIQGEKLWASKSVN